MLGRLHKETATLLFAAGLLYAVTPLCGADYAASVLRDQPISYFRFEEPAGTKLHDSATASRGTHTTAAHDLVQAVPGALRTADAVPNHSARFIGTSFVEASAQPDLFEFHTAISIEFWIRPMAGGERTQCFISKGEFTRTNCNYYVVYFQDAAKSGRLRFGIADGHLDQASRLDEDVFTHVVVTFDAKLTGNNTRLYINGRLDAEKRIEGQPRDTTGTPLSIGALLYDLPQQPRIQFFVGELDEIAFYDSVLPESRVAAHYAQRSPPVIFESAVRPILARACFSCHGEKQEAELDLRTVTSMLRGGQNGPAIVRGAAAQSMLLERINFNEMPPADFSQQLSLAERRLIELWIDGGCQAEEAVTLSPPVSLVKAEERRHWAFQPIRRSVPPLASAANQRSVRTPVDAFIQASLSRQGLALAPDADRMRLARRLFIDLIGLPPPRSRVDAFLEDQRPDAVARLVDELLASPQFGIRWGRHWLDVVGYTDTISFDDDYGPPIGFVKGKWRYRDYVISSFNQDKVASRFLTEQLAGDQLVDWRNAERYTPEMIESLVATGYLRCCEDISKEDPRPFIIWSVLHDSVEQIGTSLLGLTLNCARCHTHKFEPLPQRDYYRLMAVLTPALNPASWKDPQQRALPDVAPARLAEINQHNAAIDERVKQQQAVIDRIRSQHEDALREAKLVAISGIDHEAVRVAFKLAADKRDAQQKALLARHSEALKVAAEEIDAALSMAERRESERSTKAIETANAQRRTHGWIHAMYDVGAPPPTRLFQQGSYLNPRREIAAGFLEVLSQQQFTSYLEQALPTTGSGYRLALARWMTDPSSPASGLVLRVMVNRIWGTLLGSHIVATPDNLGLSGATPSHPELLDWLAAELRRDGSWKQLIRQITASSVYRQASFGSHPSLARAREIDPDNRLYWRARLRRVEAEVLRDSILSAAGQLETSMGGPPVPLEYLPTGEVLVARKGLKKTSARLRRSVYLLNRRIYNPSFLSVFDKPIVTGSVCQRPASAVALQSLSMLNDQFVVEQAQHLAARVAAAAPSTTVRIEHLFWLTLSRSPSTSELEFCQQMLNDQIQLHRASQSADADALAELCQAILNLNEQLYLE